MTYALSEGLQVAFFDVLSSTAAISGQIGNAIYDEVPDGQLPETYITLGVETVRDRSGSKATVAVHDLVVSVLSSVSGFREAKAVAGAISDSLTGARPVLARGRVVETWFVRARARRVQQQDKRRIDLTFRVLVQDE